MCKFNRKYMNQCKYMKQKLNKIVWCTKDNKKCTNCNFKEFQQNDKSLNLNRQIKGKKHKLTKATEITKDVKIKVWERDNHKCIFCGKEVSLYYANSHYIKRSHSGLGIEQNIMTNCEQCHKLFEESVYRTQMKEFAKNYLSNKYENWKEKDLIYKKYK